MKAVAIGLAAVAAVVLYKYMSTAAAPPPYYPPPPPAPAKHWYDTALGFLGTVAGTALGTYAGVANRTRSAPVPSKTAAGGTAQHATSASRTTYTNNYSSPGAM